MKQSPEVIDKQARGAVYQLERDLYAGFITETLFKLEDLSLRGNYLTRSAANWILAKWYYLNGLCNNSMKNLSAMTQISSEHDWYEDIQTIRFVSLYAIILMDLDFIDQSEQLLLPNIKQHTEVREFQLLMGRLEICRYGDSEYGVKKALSWYNRLYSASGFSELIFREGDGIGRITTSVIPPAVNADDMITIVMPTFNSGDTISYAIDSVLRQSWDNLELIIVDDLSVDCTLDIVADYMRCDKRVKLVRTTSNSGPYVAQNRGLSISQGKYIASHGSDDWSHPQKFEAQMKSVGANIPCTASHAIRMAHDLRYQVKPDTVGAFSLNASSYLYRTADLIKLGGWDDARMAADNELIERVSRIYNAKRLVVAHQVPLSLIYVSDSTLSSSSINGLMSSNFGVRKEYHDFAAHWRNSVSKEELALHGVCRPFPVPRAIGERSNEAIILDTLFITHFWCEDEWFQSVYSEMLQDLKPDGCNIGLLNVPQLGAGKLPFSEFARKLLYTGNARIICAGDDVIANKVFAKISHDTLAWAYWPKIVSESIVTCKYDKLINSDTLRGIIENKI
jgi:glycosyltransferase involved in cell wall biosynthesis